MCLNLQKTLTFETNVRTCQVESLKHMIAKKDDEIERLQLQKDPRSTNSALPSKRSTNSLANNGSQSPTSTDQEDFIDRNSDSSSAQLTGDVSIQSKN